MNAEKKAINCLSASSKMALQLVNESLASDSLDSKRASWHLFISNARCHFTPEHGTRFGIKGRNSSIMVTAWDELIAFAKSHPTSSKLQKLLALMQKDIVRDELLCLAAVWTICLEPLWFKLKSSNVVDSINMLNSFIQLASDSQHLDPAALIKDGTKNCSLRVASLGDIAKEVFELLGTYKPLDELDFQDLLRKMLDSAAGYVRSLQGNWDVENVPSSLSKITFSNQVIYIILNDTILNHYEMISY